MIARLRSAALIVPLVLLSTLGRADPVDPFLTRDLPGYLELVRKTFDVPGMAVAIIKDGKVVFARGSGVRTLRDRTPVDIDTLFCIASNTKSVTATAIGMLVDDGKLNLDDRVTDHLPWFQMSDPYVTRELRVRDLLAHRSGLAAHAGDLLYMPGTRYTLRQVVERLKDLPLQSSFRSDFAYENVLFAAATLVIEQVSGMSYADFVRQRIFTPLGMNASRIDGASLTPADNYAVAYSRSTAGQLQETPILIWKNNQGAGGIYSSVKDMSRWVQMQLGSTEVPRLINERTQHDLWSMAIPIPITAQSDPDLHKADPQFQGYALGWFVSDYRGHGMVWHTGGFPGTVSLVTLLPGEHLGIVVLTNQETDDAFQATQLHILDHYLKLPPTDWLSALHRDVARQDRSLAEATARAASERVPDARPPLPLNAYAGTYADAWYGAVDVTFEGGALRLHFDASPRMTGTLSPWRDNTFLVQWDERALQADALITFGTDARGNVTTASMRRASPVVSRAYDYPDLHLVRAAN